MVTCIWAPFLMTIWDAFQSMFKPVKNWIFFCYCHFKKYNTIRYNFVANLQTELCAIVNGAS